jgi:hypothetical protein
MNGLVNNLPETIVDLFREYPRVRFIALSLSIPLMLIALIAWSLGNVLFPPWFNDGTRQIWPILLIFFTVISIAGLTSFAPLRSDSAAIYNEKIAEAESKVEAEPQKVRPAWDLARITLEAYFNRNLSQITAIFWLSVVVMMVGFAIIVWGIAGAFQSKETIMTAAIATTAGVITEFIGATFLFVYRSTIQQGMSYSRTLERINAVGMAMQILDTMPDETKKDDLKSKTKAMLVELLVRQANEASIIADEIDKGAGKSKTA